MIVVKKSKNGFRVQTIADNNEPLQTSEELETKEAVYNHIVSLVKHIKYTTNLNYYQIQTIHCRIDEKEVGGGNAFPLVKIYEGVQLFFNPI